MVRNICLIQNIWPFATLVSDLPVADGSWSSEERTVLKTEQISKLICQKLKVDLSKAQRYGQCCDQDRDVRTTLQIKSSNWTLMNLIDYPRHFAPVQLLLGELDKSSNEDLQMIVTHWICEDKSFNTSSISKDKGSWG